MPLGERSQCTLKCKWLMQNFLLTGVEGERYHRRIHAMECKRGIDKRSAKKKNLSASIRIQLKVIPALVNWRNHHILKLSPKGASTLYKGICPCCYKQKEKMENIFPALRRTKIYLGNRIYGYKIRITLYRLHREWPPLELCGVQPVKPHPVAL